MLTCRSLFRHAEENEAITYWKMLLPINKDIKPLQIFFEKSHIIRFIVCWVFCFILKYDCEKTIPLPLTWSFIEQAFKSFFVAVVYHSLEKDHLLGDELFKFLLWNNVKRMFSRVLMSYISKLELVRLLKHLQGII